MYCKEQRTLNMQKYVELWRRNSFLWGVVSSMSLCRSKSHVSGVFLFPLLAQCRFMCSILRSWINSFLINSLFLAKFFWHLSYCSCVWFSTSVQGCISIPVSPRCSTAGVWVGWTSLDVIFFLVFNFLKLFGKQKLTESVTSLTMFLALNFSIT